MLRYGLRKKDWDYDYGPGLKASRTRAQQWAKKETRLELLERMSCDHSQMTECHPGCGHFSCPCGVSWDEGSDGGYYEDATEPMFDENGKLTEAFFDWCSSRLQKMATPMSDILEKFMDENEPVFKALAKGSK